MPARVRGWEAAAFKLRKLYARSGRGGGAEGEAGGGRKRGLGRKRAGGDHKRFAPIPISPPHTSVWGVRGCEGVCGRATGSNANPLDVSSPPEARFRQNPVKMYRDRESFPRIYQIDEFQGARR
jgi:hypothetical protein